MLVEITLVFLLVILVWTVISFRGWKRKITNTLREESEVANTARGKIEYALQGNGPVVLMLHGAPGGYDQGSLDMDMWVNEGFSLLTISRPGYLRTPLSTGKTFQEQADAISALLDALGISKVAIVAASAGGPVALHFALHHPDRISALVLMAAASQQYTVEENQMHSLLGRILMSDTIADFGVWLYDILTRYWTSMSLKQMFNENVTLEPEELDEYVDEVMAIPEEVAWYKRFVRTTCPMSLRNAGLNNDLEQLGQVSFDNLDVIECPTLVVHGTADGDVSYTNAEFSASSIPDARLYSLDGVGHIVGLGEHVPEMNSEILEFLGESM
ncbi:MAG: alpha/beta fold hydrolase [Candidatus Lokiarchaeota archaeon]|nr:alpha/beta fold hydrolase [Candidatus Lokiarchaeota archaeon]